MKTNNNATIFENIHERGYMTEKEMLLLKSRSNKQKKTSSSMMNLVSMFHYLRSGQIRGLNG